MAPIELPAPPEPDPLSDPLSLAVMAEASERGYHHLTVHDVIARAGVSEAEFEERYPDLETCVLDTYERLITSTSRRIGIAFNRHSQWRDALRAAAYALADLAEENPDSVRFGMAEVLTMRSETARLKREGIFVFCAQLVERGRAAAPYPDAVPEGAAMFAAGSIIQLLTRRLQEGVEIDYHRSARESIYSVVRTYLGDAAAREELEMPLPSLVVAR
jgi:AcrR family transcriptional regulator